MHKIQEMAETRKEVQKILRGNDVEEMIEHLIKIIIFNSPKNINHWKTEVYSKFHGLPLMKHNKKPPDKKFIFDTIWDYFGDRLEYIIDCVIRKEPEEKLKSKLDSVLANEVYTKVLAYIEWLSKKLSEKTVVTNQEVYDKLEELGL